MMYTYKELKTRKGMLNHLKTLRLISMSVSLNHHDNSNITPIYLVADPRFSKDLKTIQFSTFSVQEPLNEYLYENPSGLYLEGTPPLSWTIQAGNPHYLYRDFEVDGKTYCILRIYDAGLILNLLLGKTYVIPFMLHKVNNLTGAMNRFNLSDLFNLGLLGRVMSVNFSTKHMLGEIKLPDNLNLISFNHKNDSHKNYFFSLFLGSNLPITIKGFADWKQVSITPEQQTVKQWSEREGFPVTTYQVQDGEESIIFTIKPVLAVE